MAFKDLLKKEIFVAVHGQTAKFRIVKYIVLFGILSLVYTWKGQEGVLLMLGVLFVLAIAMHFFFRWKSKGWDEDYGLYKSLFKNK